MNMHLLNCNKTRKMKRPSKETVEWQSLVRVTRKHPYNCISLVLTIIYTTQNLL